jgi:heme-degrading monooxygenase HmoA
LFFFCASDGKKTLAAHAILTTRMSAGVLHFFEVNMTIAETPAAPYYAVIFTSIRTARDNGYEEMAEAMFQLASQQPGFLGFESAREGLGITVSYWDNPESISAWQRNSSHLVAQQRGRAEWYQAFKVRVCRVERDYAFQRTTEAI